MTDQRQRNDEDATAPVLATGNARHERDEGGVGKSDASQDAEPRGGCDAETEDISRDCGAHLSTSSGLVADTSAVYEPGGDSSRGCEAVAEYLLRIDGGEQVDRERFIAEHPGEATELRQYFADLDSLDACLGPAPLASHLASSDSLPESIGRYRIDSLLGQGGMGRVLKAEHPRMKRPVALKVLCPKVVRTPEALQRFQREVEAAARLTHPNIVIAYDADEADGTHFLVMEYIAGSDLSSLVKKNGPLPLSQALDCILQAARGLQYAHEHGVVHRDVKPSNLLLDEQGTVKILDLGLARLDSMARDQDELTGSGQIMGTIDFMAPEQAKSTKDADARADIYSLGATLWVLVTGQPLYAAETTVGKLMAHQTKPIPTLRSVCPAASPPIEAMFHRMVAKTPEMRYQTMAAVIADLEPLCNGTFPPPAPRMHKSETAKDSSPVAMASAVRDGWRDWRLLTALGAGGLLLILLSVWIIIRDKDGREIARFQVPAGGTVYIEAPAESDDGRRLKTPVLTESVAPPDATVPLPQWTLPPGAPPPAIAPFDAAQAKAHQEAWAEYLGVEVEFQNSIGMTFMLIPPGEFNMGSTTAEVAIFLEDAKAINLVGWYIERLPSEAPRHRVRITKPFWLGAHEVTLGQFHQFVSDSAYQTEAERDGEGGYAHVDGQWKQDPRFVWNGDLGFERTDNHPVVNVSWHDVTAFCEWLSDREGETSHLPSESQWEYACRAGSTTRWHSGDDQGALQKHAWYQSNAGSKTQPVGQKLPNAWGLYDMHGNVWEWCQDWFGDGYYVMSPPEDPPGPSQGSARVYRGGCWHDVASFARASWRNMSAPSYRHVNHGFRVARTISDE